MCVQQNIIFLADYLNGKGYRPATVTDQEACISCVKCAQICPDTVITVFRPERKKQAVCYCEGSVSRMGKVLMKGNEVIAEAAVTCWV